MNAGKKDVLSPEQEKEQAEKAKREKAEKEGHDKWEVARRALKEERLTNPTRQPEVEQFSLMYNENDFELTKKLAEYIWLIRASDRVSEALASFMSQSWDETPSGKASYLRAGSELLHMLAFIVEGSASYLDGKNMLDGEYFPRLTKPSLGKGPNKDPERIVDLALVRFLRRLPWRMDTLGIQAPKGFSDTWDDDEILALLEAQGKRSSLLHESQRYSLFDNPFPHGVDECPAFNFAKGNLNDIFKYVTRIGRKKRRKPLVPTTQSPLPELITPKPITP